MIRVPNAQEFAAMPYAERVEMLRRLAELRLSWLETERPT